MMNLTKKEIELLLYLESHSINQSCLVSEDELNAFDTEIIELWKAERFIEVFRIPPVSPFATHKFTISVKLSDAAFQLAQKERKLMIKRISKNRDDL